MKTSQVKTLSVSQLLEAESDPDYITGDLERAIFEIASQGDDSLEHFARIIVLLEETKDVNAHSLLIDKIFDYIFIHSGNSERPRDEYLKGLFKQPAKPSRSKKGGKTK